MLHAAGAGAAALALAPWSELRAADAAGFTLPKLPYPYDALEPSIDEETMKIHHDKHHQAYITKLNDGLKGHPELLKMKIDELLLSYEKQPKEVQALLSTQGGGHANHTLFWEIMGPKAGGKPSGSLAKAIDSTFGSFEKFQEAFSKLAVGQFGSGWAWLIVDKGKLEAINLPNQISPLLKGQRPILGIDVWEHAYYLKYKNLRPAYVEAWWKVVNWPVVEKHFEKALKS
jgi:Fe-Mn family superoxide dismutase